MHAMNNRIHRAPASKASASRRNLPGLDFEAPLCGEISTRLARVSSLDSSALSLFAFVVLTQPADLQ